MQHVKKKLDEYKEAFENDEQEEDDIASRLFLGYNMITFKRMMRQKAKQNTLKQEETNFFPHKTSNANKVASDVCVIISSIEIIPKLQSNSLRSPYLSISMENVIKETPR